MTEHKAIPEAALEAACWGLDYMVERDAVVRALTAALPVLCAEVLAPVTALADEWQSAAEDYGYPADHLKWDVVHELRAVLAELDAL